MVGRGVFLCLLLTLVLFVSLPAGAQVTGGTLSGTITDSSGAGIPQAQIIIKDVASGVGRPETNNEDGFDTAVNLLAGSCQVAISAKDFNTETKSGVAMSVG